jgi:hypothetical protein
MRNPITTATMLDELQQLLTAFPRHGKQDVARLAEVYKHGLVGVETEALHGAVHRAIQDDEFFPKIARLRALADSWMKRNRAAYAPTIATAWDTCGVCGARAKPRQILRPVLAKPTKDSPTWHYPLSDGRRLKQGDVIGLQSLAHLLTLETVESTSLYLDHDPRLHHVQYDDEGSEDSGERYPRLPATT